MIAWVLNLARGLLRRFRHRHARVFINGLYYGGMLESLRFENGFARIVVTFTGSALARLDFQRISDLLAVNSAVVMLDLHCGSWVMTKGRTEEMTWTSSSLRLVISAQDAGPT